MKYTFQELICNHHFQHHETKDICLVLFFHQDRHSMAWVFCSDEEEEDDIWETYFWQDVVWKKGFGLTIRKDFRRKLCVGWI